MTSISHSILCSELLNLRRTLKATLSLSRSCVTRISSTLRIVSLSITELKCRLQEHCKKINQVLRTIKRGECCLLSLIFLSLLRLLVINLFISDSSHLFGIAVFNIERVLTLKEYVARKLFCQLALILLFKVHEGLLCTFNHCYPIYFTLTSCLEVNLKLFSCSTNWEVFDKQRKEHD